MKRFITSAVLSIALATTGIAQAGNIAPPPSDPVVIVEDTQANRGQLIVPILALILFAAVLSGGSSAAGGVALSDERLKRDIVPTGQTAAGFPTYTYRYIGGSQRFVGVMAQDVMATRPDAIVVGPFGYMAVKYGLLGIEMTAVD